MRVLLRWGQAAALPLLLVLCGYGPALFCVFLAWSCHELGHLLAALALGLPPHGLSPTLSGGLRLMLPALPDERELLLALAGPAANLIFSLVLRQLACSPALAASSLLLGLSSLLPFLPLDGGRALRVFLLRKWGWWQPSRLLSAGGELLGMLLLPVVLFLPQAWLLSLWGAGLFYLCLHSRRSLNSAYLYYLLALRRHWREAPALPRRRIRTRGEDRAWKAARLFSPAFRCRFLFWEGKLRQTAVLDGEDVLEAVLCGEGERSLKALWQSGQCGGNFFSPAGFNAWKRENK